MRYSDVQRLQLILEIWEKLESHIREDGITRETLLSNELLQWAVTAPLMRIGEHVYRISDTMKKEYPAIPWPFVSGLRHRLVHDYEGINWNMITEIVFTDMPDFIREIREIISALNDSNH